MTDNDYNIVPRKPIKVQPTPMKSTPDHVVFDIDDFIKLSRCKPHVVTINLAPPEIIPNKDLVNKTRTNMGVIHKFMTNQLYNNLTIGM